jgi:metallo-beta-lactamase class B
MRGRRLICNFQVRLARRRIVRVESLQCIAVGVLLTAAFVARAAAKGPQTADTIEAHVAAAKAAAGQDYVGVFNTLCPAPAPPAAPRSAAQAPPPGPPPRSQWHAEPVKVFDNLYFLGQTEYSVWAITTSRGIILVDTIWDYSIEDEVAGGLTKLGLDPRQIKYAIISHGHIDHAGGAAFLQEKYNTRIIVSAADWDLLAKDSGSWPKPQRDMVATDGERLTLGDTTLILYLTPGHTLGTISTLIPVKDHGVPHMVLDSGGTAFNWLANRRGYITPERPDTFWFNTYISSVERIRDVAAQAGADVIVSNHTIFDGSKTKLPAVLARKAGDPNPYVVGKDSVRRYLTVEDECAKAGLLRVKQ